MPDLTAQANELKQAPDQALQAELQHPSGAVAPFLVMSEAQRRQLTRQAAQSQQSQGQSGSVYDDIVRSMMARQPPQNLPAAPAGMAPISNTAPGAAPQNFQAPPTRMMAEGGHFQDGGLDDEDEDEFSSADPFLAAGANPFIQQPQGQAQGIAAIGAPQGSGELSPEQFQQALAGPEDEQELSPEEFLQKLQAGKTGGHGGRKGHGGKRGGKGKGAAAAADDASGGGKSGFKISKVLTALGKMGGASHGIAAHAPTLHPPHFAMLHPMQQHHAQGFHFAGGGALHFARGGGVWYEQDPNDPGYVIAHGTINGVPVRSRMTTQQALQAQTGTTRTRSAGRTPGAPKPAKNTARGVERPGNDPSTGKPYEGSWLHTWYENPTTGEVTGEKWDKLSKAQSGWANRPMAGAYIGTSDLLDAMGAGQGVMVSGPNGMVQVPNTPEAQEQLRKLLPHGAKYWVDRSTGAMIVTPFTPQETERMVPGVDALGNPTLVPGGMSTRGVQGGMQPMQPGGAMTPPPQQPQPAPSPQQVQPGIQQQPAQPLGTPPPAQGEMTPWELSEDARTQNFIGGTRQQYNDFRARQVKAIPLREAASELLGNPDEKGFPGYIGMADHMNDPVFVAHVGAALKRTLSSMEEGSRGASISASFGPVAVSTGDFGTLLSNYLGMPQRAIDSTLAVNRQMIGSLTGDEQKAYRMGLAAITMSVGLKGLAPGSRSEAAMHQIQNEVPLIGVNAFNRSQFVEGFRPLTNEIKQGVPIVEKAGVSPGVLSVMKQGSDRIDNLLSGATIPRTTITAMAQKWNAPPEDMERRAEMAGFKVTDDPAASPDIQNPSLTLEQRTSGNPNPTTFSDWFHANRGKDQSPPQAAPLTPEQQKQLGVGVETPPTGAQAQTPSGEQPTALERLYEGADTPAEKATRTADLLTKNPFWSLAAEGSRKLFGQGPPSWMPSWLVPAYAPQSTPRPPAPQPPPQTGPVPPTPQTAAPNAGPGPMHAPQMAPTPPAPAAKPQDDEEEILRRAQEIQRRRAAEQERQRREQQSAVPSPTTAGPPPAAPVPQAAPTSQGKDTGPLPWEQPQQQARGGQIFDRAPTRGETLRALTRR